MPPQAQQPKCHQRAPPALRSTRRGPGPMVSSIPRRLWEGAIPGTGPAGAEDAGGRVSAASGHVGRAGGQGQHLPANCDCLGSRFPS